MIPHERELAERLSDKPFTLLGINSDESRSALKKTMADEKITWPQIHDGKPAEGPIAKQWNIHAWPMIFVIDHTGVIRHRGLRDKELDGAVLKLIEAVPQRGGRTTDQHG